MPIASNSYGITSDMSFSDSLVYPGKYIVLSGSCLPFRGIRFGGGSRIQVQEYQGSNFAQINVFNPIETDLQIRGRWNGQWINGTDGEIEYGEVGTPKKLSDDMKSDAFMSMMRFCQWMDEWRASGPFVAFSWYGIHRMGVMSNFEYEIDDTNYIQWDMTIKWESYKNVQGVSKITNLEGPESIGMDWAAKFKSLVGMLEQALGLDPLNGAYGPNIPVVSDIFDAMRDVDKQMKRFNDALASAERMNELISTGVMKPLEVISNFYATVANMKGTMQRMSEIWESNAVSHMNAVEYNQERITKSTWSSSMPGTASSGDIPDAVYEHGIPGGKAVGYDSTSEIEPSHYVGAAHDIKAGMTSALDFDIRAIILDMKADVVIASHRMDKFARQGAEIIDVYISEDQLHLGAVSVKYYGTWSKWPKLADYNGIVNPVLPAGRVIVIPRSL